MEKLIRLNFFALSNQDIRFLVYRQEFHGQKKQSGYYKTKLPIKPASEDYAEYWVTKEEKEGFEKFYFSGYENPLLTIKLLWDSFRENVKKSFDPVEYIFDKGDFSKKVAIIIGRYPEGNQVIELEPYFLKSKKKYGFLVDFAFRSAPNIPYSIRIQELSLSIKRNRSNSDFNNDKYEKIFQFKQKMGSRLFPFVFGDQDIDIEEKMYPLESNSLRAKTFVFQNGKESNSQFQGIKANGPLEPINKEPLYVFIFEPNQREQANSLYSALVGKTFTQTFEGLESMFQIPISKDHIKQISIPSIDELGLKTVENQLESIVSENQNKAVIGLFIMNENELSPTSSFSPYHFLKFVFTKHRVPLQTVRYEKIMGRDGLKWSVANIGLQVFAKLGGKPWKVKPSNEKCLIFGLGCAHKWGEDAKIHKYFAYSVCLDSSGIYRKVNVLGNSTDKRTYITQLRENIKVAISENISTGIEKCVIHLPFKIKKDEMEYIRSGMLEISEVRKDIEFQFIKINTKNKFFGYAENNSKVPFESTYIQLSSNDFLVWFEGLQHYNPALRKRVGNPIHIEFLYGSVKLDFEGKRSYLQDILNLSGANWRGFNAKLAPISVFYPDLIAEFLAEFRQLMPGEDVDLNSFYIPWFL